MSQVCGIFNSRLLPSRSVVQAKTVAIAYVVVRISWTFLSQETRIFVNESLTQGITTPNSINLLKQFIYIQYILYTIGVYSHIHIYNYTYANVNVIFSLSFFFIFLQVPVSTENYIYRPMKDSKFPFSTELKSGSLRSEVSLSMSLKKGFQFHRKASQSLALPKAAPRAPLLRLRVKVTGKFKGASCFSVQKQAEKYHSVKSSHLSKNITDIH